MDKYKELADHLKSMGGKQVTVMQGIVKAVDGNTCSVQIGGILISGVRLRASESSNDKEILIVPKKNTPVIVGSLSGDMTQLAVLSVDQVESITINGGKLGGLINIEDLTSKLNDIEDDINSLKTAMAKWVPMAQDGGLALKTEITDWTTQRLVKSQRGDYEDETIKH